MTSESAEPLLEVDLVPERNLGTGDTTQRLRGYLSLGMPVVMPLTVEAATLANNKWRSFLEAEAATSDYFSLGLILGFRAAPDYDPVVRATVSVSLEAPGRDEQPIAWSIAPRIRMHPTGRPIRASLSVTLGFLESTVDYTPEPTRDEAFLVASGERTDNPEWRFRALPGVPLVGDEELAIVVKAAAGSALRARVAIAARVRQRRLRGFLRYRAELPASIETIEFGSALPARE